MSKGSTPRPVNKKKWEEGWAILEKNRKKKVKGAT